MLVLDSGGLSRLCRRTPASVAIIEGLRAEGLWPPLVHTMVLVESTTGTVRDANVNRLLRACEVEPIVDEAVARRAAQIRSRARTGSAVDALLVALAEPGGTVLTSDEADLRALAEYAVDVAVKIV